MDAALVILDGWGLRSDGGVDGDPVPTVDGRDAVDAADTPNVDRYTRAGAAGRLTTAGRAVGLPDGQAGNSEVGHLTIGAGRVVRQAYTRIEDAIAGDALLERPAVADAFAHVERTGGRLHLLGLLSDGGVHADHTHLHALIEGAAERGVTAITHPFTDGRDTSPTAGEGFVAELEAVAEAAGTGHPATVIGRYYAMDRDEHWERTHAAYRAIVERVADHAAPSASDAVRAAYDRGETDEFVEPTLVTAVPGAVDDPGIGDGDAVLVCNFRADRARQLVRMLADHEPVWRRGDDAVEPPPAPPDVHVATMTEYDETFPFPVAFPPAPPGETLGTVLADAGLTQLRIAESEKYAHVTYFLNGGREGTVPGERREIVPSPDVPTYDLRPEMSAAAVTDRAVSLTDSEDPDVLVLNYANPDMVGHTGRFDATVAAVEAVDEQVGRLVPALRDAGAHVLLTADHGNAEQLGTVEDPHTAHTRNPVPFVALAPAGDTAIAGGASGGLAVRSTGASADGGEQRLPGLRNVTPTILAIAGLARPDEMTGRSLLVDGDAVK